MFHIVSRAAAIAACAIAVTAATGSASPNVAERPTHHHTAARHHHLPVWATRPCKSEDSVNCRWIASERGNRRGHGFIVRELPGHAHMVCVFYIRHRYAATHDYCMPARWHGFAVEVTR